MGMCCSAPSSNKTDVTPTTKPRPPTKPASSASAPCPAPSAQPQKSDRPRAASGDSNLAALRKLEAQLRSISVCGEDATVEPLAQTDDTLTQVHQKESLEAQLQSIRSGEDRKESLEAQLQGIRSGEDRKGTQKPSEPVVPTDDAVTQVPGRQSQQNTTAEVQFEPIPPDESERIATASHEPAKQPNGAELQPTQA